MQAKQPESDQPSQELGYQRGGFGGIARDAAESLLSAPGAGLKALMGLPEHYQAGKEYVENNPWYNTAGQLAMGAPELAAGLISAPQVAGRYLAEKFSDPKGAIYKGIHRTPTPSELLSQAEQGMGIAPSERGSGELRALGQMIASGKPLASIPSRAGRVGAVTAAATGQGGDPIHAALGAWLGEKGFGAAKKTPEFIESALDRTALDDQINQVQDELAQQSSALKTAQAEAGAKSPESLHVKSQELEGQIGDLEQQLQSLAPEQEGAITDPTQMIPNLAHENNLTNALNLLEQSQQNTDAAHESQGMQLGRGEDFQERAAPLVIQHVENVKNQISPRYDAINNAARDLTVNVPNHERAQEIQTQMDALVRQGTINPSNDAIYDSIFEQLAAQWPGDAAVDIPAPQYINMYKSTRDLSRVARSRSRQEGLQQPERQQWEARANELEPIVREQRRVLESELPNNLFADLLETDRMWGEQVIPFYRNKIYQDSRQNGLAPKNMIDVTAGNAPHRQIMQQAIQNNPELNRLAIGQQYAHRPHELMDAPERLQPYINAHAPTSRIMEVQQRAMQANERAQAAHDAALERAEQQRERQQSMATEARGQEQQRVKLHGEIEKLTKSLEENKAKTEKLEREIQKHGITKERLAQLNKYKKEREAAKSKLWGVATGGLGYLIGHNVIGTIFTALFK